MRTRTLSVLLSIGLLTAACGSDGTAGEDSKTSADGSSTGEGSAPVAVEMVNSGTNQDWCALVAWHAGYFKEEGILVPEKPLAWESDASTVRALISGEVDISIIGAGAVTAADQAGGDPGFKVIVGGSQTPYSLVGPEKVEALSDLNDSTIALPPEGQASALVAESILNETVGEGNWEAIHVGGGSSSRLAAVQSGQADAAFMSAPIDEVLVLENPDYHVVEYMDNMGIPPYQMGMYAASNDWLKENPEAAVRWVRAYVKGCEAVYDPNLEKVVVDSLAAGGYAREAVQASYDLYIAGSTDLGDALVGTTPPRNGEVNREALANSAEVIDEALGLQTDVDTLLTSVVDDSYWRTATGADS